MQAERLAINFFAPRLPCKVSVVRRCTNTNHGKGKAFSACAHNFAQTFMIVWWRQLKMLKVKTRQGQMIFWVTGSEGGLKIVFHKIAWDTQNERTTNPSHVRQCWNLRFYVIPPSANRKIAPSFPQLYGPHSKQFPMTGDEKQSTVKDSLSNPYMYRTDHK